MKYRKQFANLYSSFMVLCLAVILAGNSSCAYTGSNAKKLTEAKKSDKIYLFNRLSKRECIYYNDCSQGLVQIYINPNDSVIILSNRKQFIYQPNDKQNFYLLYPGDRIEISKDSLGNFIFTTLNKDTVRNNELDIMRLVNINLEKSFNSLIMYTFSPKSKHDDNAIYDKYTHDVFQFIDNYEQNKKISSGFETDLKNFIKYTMLCFQIESARIAKNNIDTQTQHLMDSLIAEPHHADDGDQYFGAVYSYIFYKTLRDAGQMDSRKINPEAAYDLAGKTVKDSATKDIVLLYIIKLKIAQAGMDKSSEMIRRFLTDCKTKEYTEYINKMVAQNKTLTELSGDSIYTLNAEMKSLSSILKDNSGKLIYIDCWASWCAPCRANMPVEKELEKKYAQRNIVFMYFSIDTDIDSWKKAVREEKLDAKIHNYLIGGNSSFAKKYNIKTIPRYLLVGKDGNIISADAPRPGDEALQDLIEKNL